MIEIFIFFLFLTSSEVRSDGEQITITETNYVMTDHCGIIINCPKYYSFYSFDIRNIDKISLNVFLTIFFF